MAVIRPANRIVLAAIAVSGSSNADPYITDFGATEDPIVEDGNWVLGGDDGVLYQNCETANGRLIASGTSPTEYDDCLVIRASGVNKTAHYVEWVVHRAGGYSPADNHEMEGLVGFSIWANNNAGYECLFNTSGGFQIIRQSGPRGGFFTGLTVTNHNGGVGNLAHGDTVRCEYEEETTNTPTVRVYINGQLRASMTDSSDDRIYAAKLLDGSTRQCQPGNGFFSRGSGFVAGSFCIESAEYGSL